MSNGKGKYKCTKEHKEVCKSQGKVAYYDKEENKCGCKPVRPTKEVKSKRLTLERTRENIKR